MPNLTTPFLNLKGEDINDDMQKIKEWSVSLIDELKYILCNLDAGNVSEANSVKAQNIDCTTARIKGAQIQSLTADKLSAGTIDAGEITVKGESDRGKMVMSGETLAFYEKGNSRPRIYIGRDGDAFVFEVQSSDGKQGVYMDESGQVYMTGILSTDKDCLIQGDLRVGMSGNNKKGIVFYGDAYFPDENGNYSAPYARILPYVANNEEFKGINVTGGKLCVEENPVATVKDIEALRAEIKSLSEKLQSHIDSVS